MKTIKSQWQYWLLAIALAALVVIVRADNMTVFCNPPSITGQPTSRTNFQGSTASFMVTIGSGTTLPVKYFWKKNSTNLDSGNVSWTTTSSLIISNIASADAAAYSVQVFNTCGGVTSSSVTLTVKPTTITFSNFCDVSLLQINGNAAAINTTADGCVLELTPSTASQAGSAFLKTPIALSSNASFSTFFSFRLSKSDGWANSNADYHVGADGIVFVLQTLTNNVGSAGGGIGFWGITNSVGVVFDTWFNKDGDPTFDPQLADSQTVLITTNANGTTGDGNHVGVVYNGYLTNAATFNYGLRTNGYNAAAQHVMDDMNNSNVWYAWIDYNGATSNLQVRLSEHNSRPLAPTLTNTVNLLDFLGTSNTYVGFTAGSGKAFNQQDILSWQINTRYSPIGFTNTLSVQILSPIKKTFLARSNLLIQVLAAPSDTNTPIKSVQLFIGANTAGTNKLGYAVLNPTNGLYQLPWITVFGGTYVITAQATDTLGSNLWSAPVTNYVRSLPYVSIVSPTNGQVFSLMSPMTTTNILISATATPDGATITNVMFYKGTNIIGTDTSSPFGISWNSVTNGAYTLHARATDNFGASGISSNILITVEPANQPPRVNAGPDQTNFFTANPVQLAGWVLDDGLPLASVLVVHWTELSGPTNVTFINSNAPVTGVYLPAPGNYVLELSASDGQYPVSSNLTITILKTNTPPVVYPGTNQTIVLPTISTNVFGTLYQYQITDSIPSPTGIDYFGESNCVMVSVHYNEGGIPFNFELVSSNGNWTQFSSLSNLSEEVYISTVRSTIGGFKVGEMFTGNGVDGQILRIEPDGTTIGTILWTNSGIVQSNAWVDLPTLTLSNGVTVTPGLLRGGLWVDRTGVWGGNLIVITEQGNYDPSPVGYVWRVNSQGQATFVAQMVAQPTGEIDGDTFEGVTTCPNDSEKYGPLAGCILVGGDLPGDFFAINTNGFVVRYNFPFGAEDIRIVPQNENFFGCTQSGGEGMFGIPASQFSGMVGDILVCDENTKTIYRLQWNGREFEAYSVLANPPTGGYLEGVNFAPAGLFNLPSAGWVQLNGVVTDDGELFSPTSNTWSVVSGPTNEQTEFSDSQLTNSTVNFSMPGTYVLQLSAFDGEYTISSNVTITVIQNQAPWVFAGTNQFISTNITELQGVVTNIILPPPYNVTNILWTVISAPPGVLISSVVFAPTNQTQTQVTFNGNTGVYVLCLTADDGQATNSAYVTINYLAPANILTPRYVITPTNNLATLTLRFVDPTNGPLTNSLIQFHVYSSTDGSIDLPDGYLLTDTNGFASLTYTNMSSTVGQDVFEFSSSNYTQVIAYETNYWGYNTACGDRWTGQQFSSSSDFSIDPWNDGYHYADYYVFNDNVGDIVQFALTGEQVGYEEPANPLIMFLRNSSNQVVAVSPATQSGGGPNSTVLTFGIPSSGQYTLEVANIGNISSEQGNKYDLYVNCAVYTNPAPLMEVLYNGTNIPNGGVVIFPSTSVGSLTNIDLVVTNAGNLSYQITNVMYGGDFNLTNDLTGQTISSGSSANLGVIFNASSNETSLGDLVLSANYPGGSNYVIYFEASTSATGAVPVIQLTSPPDGSTFLDQSFITFTAVVTPGSADINPSSVSALLLNTNNDGDYDPYMLTESGNFQVYTNSDVIGGTHNHFHMQDGDYTFTATAADGNNITAMAPPVLVHIVPFYSSDPAKAPAIGVWCNGTNVLNGSALKFPQTSVGAAKNISLAISNTGTYFLGVDDCALRGDYTTTNSITPCVFLPGGSTNFEITFNASDAGESDGQLVFADNVPGGGNFVIYLVGNATAPGYVPPNKSTMLPVATNQTFIVSANSQNNTLPVLSADYPYDTNAPLTVIAVKPNITANGGTVSIINNGTAITYTPPAGFSSETIGGALYPADGFSYEIQDANGKTAWGSILIDVFASSLPAVTIVSPPDGYTTNAGSIVPIVAYVTPYRYISYVQFYQGSQLLGTITNGGGGYYTNIWLALDNACGCGFTAQAYDLFGQVNTSQEIHINVTPPPGVDAPVAAFDNYAGVNDPNGPQPFTKSVVVTDGIFNLYGRTYQPQGSNVVWQLELYSQDGKTLIRSLITTNVTVGSSSVSNILMTCDLSTLQNGVYEMVLYVSGGYMESETNVQFILNSNLKIGQFGFNQQDLVIPVNGIPLTVTRTYNSLNPNKGDFGYGWTFALFSMSVSLDETRQEATDLDGNTFSERIGGGRDVSLTLPDGRLVTFQFTFDGPYGVDGKYYPKWVPPPGVNFTLTAMGNPFYDGLNGVWNNESGVGFDSFDFKGFYLTAQDNTTYVISRPDLENHFLLLDSENGFYLQAYGQPYLSQINQRNGDTIAINPDSVLFTASTGATNQITFQRNAAGLITSVSDPNGQASSGPPAVKYEYDNKDNLMRVLNLVDAGTSSYVTNSFAYTNANFQHYITGVINANGTQMAKNFYDDNGKLTAVQDADGNLTQFIHNLTNNMEVIIDRRGYTNTYVYDPRGNVIAQTNQLGQVTTMAYDANNNKTNEVLFLNGQPYATNSYAYNTNLNLMVSSTDPLGHTSTFQYDSYGNQTNSTDANGHSTTNYYDGSGNLVATSDALGDTTVYFYHGCFMLGSKDAIGTVTTNYYDPATGYLVGTATLAASGTILSSNTFAYDANGNRTNSTVWRQVNGSWAGAATAYIYDAMNRVLQTIDADGGTNTVFYNAIGKQQATTDQMGHETDYAYDAQGRLVQTTYPDGSMTKSVYDSNGNRVKSIDQEKRVTTYVYDALNRVVETIYADGTTNATVYDDLGRVARTVDARGTVTGFSYDAAGRRLTMTNAVGTSVANTNYYGYDANGNQITFTDPNNHTTTNVFDALNRQVQSLYPDGTTNSTGYDAAGRRVTGTNQDGVVTLFGYDGAGRLIAVTNALNKVTRYQYDEAGNEIVQIDALNRTNTYAYEDMGRRATKTLPSGDSESFLYDAVGNLTNQIGFNSRNYSDYINYQYDAMNRVTNRSSGYGSYYDSVNITYTVTGCVKSESHEDDYSAINHNINYIYDSRERLTQKAVVWSYGSNLYLSTSLSYNYDANGNVTKLQSGFANGVNLAYAYDPMNRVTNVLVRGQLAASYFYDGVGNLQGMHYGNGVTNLYQYDALNRLTNLVWKTNGSLSALASFAYHLKPGGTRTNLSETVSGASRSYAWSYDNLYRLTNEVVSGAAPAGSVGYGYDAVGNRTNRNSSITGLPTDSYYTYDTNDQLEASSLDNYGYDLAGNTTDYDTGTATDTYHYTAQNQIYHAIINGKTVYCTYDKDGNRLWKQVNGVGTFYLVDDRNPSGFAQVIEEYYQTNDSASAILNRVYNYGLALISQQQFNTNTLLPSTTSYYGYDGHGSVRFLMDTNGAITDTYSYDAFGSLIDQYHLGTPTPNNYLYCGQQFDPDMGLYYNRARYLNPDTGRFWSMDSYEGYRQVPISLHKYIYCQLDPANRTDHGGNLSAREIGVVVHKYIGDQFEEVVAGGVSGPSVVKILEGIPGFKLPANLQGVTTALFPDLTDTIKKEVYEIKPDNARSLAEGELQLEGYIDLFNYLDARKGWHRGTTYTPPLRVPVNALIQAAAFRAPGVPGMILYQVFDAQKVLKRKIVQTAVAENAENESDVGIASLNATLGAF